MTDEPDDVLRAGDLCHHGQNQTPRFRVIHVQDGRAWVRDVSTGADGVVDVSQCRRATEPGPEPRIQPSGPTMPDGSPWP